LTEAARPDSRALERLGSGNSASSIDVGLASAGVGRAQGLGGGGGGGLKALGPVNLARSGLGGSLGGMRGAGDLGTVKLGIDLPAAAATLVMSVTEEVEDDGDPER
jgi:hypothetical protein